MVEGVKTIGVVGAGTMGAGVAQAFAAAGYPVRLQDIGEAPLERAMAAIKKSLERLVARGKLAPADKDAALSARRADLEDRRSCRLRRRGRGRARAVRHQEGGDGRPRPRLPR